MNPVAKLALAIWTLVAVLLVVIAVVDRPPLPPITHCGWYGEQCGK